MIMNILSLVIIKDNHLDICKSSLKGILDVILMASTLLTVISCIEKCHKENFDFL